MAFRIAEFRGKALTNAGARANLFDVKMTGPTVAGLSTDEFTFACKATSVPPMAIGTIEVPYFGRTVKVPGNKTFDNWSVTIINDEGFEIRNSMEKWMAAMGTHIGNVATIGANFTAAGCNLYGDATVTHFDKTGTKTIPEYKFTNIFPVNLSEIALAWDANDAIEEFTCEFAYDYWTHTDVVTT